MIRRALQQPEERHKLHGAAHHDKRFNRDGQDTHTFGTYVAVWSLHTKGIVLLRLAMPFSSSSKILLIQGPR